MNSGWRLRKLETRKKKNRTTIIILLSIKIVVLYRLYFKSLHETNKFKRTRVVHRIQSQSLNLHRTPCARIVSFDLWPRAIPRVRPILLMCAVTKETSKEINVRIQCVQTHTRNTFNRVYKQIRLLE